MPKLTIFLDDGGVLNDDEVRGVQWPRLLGEYFVPRLGGTTEAWARANPAVLTQMLEPAAWRALLSEAPDYATFERRYYSAWLRGMCALVGLPPPTEAQCLELGVAAEAYVVPRVRAAMPGSSEAVQALRAAGYTLHTASGGGSRTLALYLTSMGVRECFGRLYGPDLVGAFKIGPAYYHAILADQGLPPEAALFVDDSPKALAWAAQTGAHTLLVGRRTDTGGLAHIPSLANLPHYLDHERGESDSRSA